MKHKPVKQWEYYKIEGNKIIRTKRTCPRCGDTYMAEHKEKDGTIRYTCGKCGMTIWE
jgi:small subunit ribosomal protein S27Ae